MDEFDETSCTEVSNDADVMAENYGRESSVEGDREQEEEENENEMLHLHLTESEHESPDKEIVNDDNNLEQKAETDIKALDLKADEEQVAGDKLLNKVDSGIKYSDTLRKKWSQNSSTPGATSCYVIQLYLWHYIGAIIKGRAVFV